MQVHGQSSLWLDLSLAACVGSSFFLGGAKEERRASPQVAGRGRLVHFSFEELAKQSGNAAPEVDKEPFGLNFYLSSPFAKMRPVCSLWSDCVTKVPISAH